MTLANNEMTAKVALVTGGARGLGASHVRCLAEAGASVVACDVLDDVGEVMADALRSEGLAVRYVHLDVTSEQSWEEAVRYAIAEFGTLNVLVNNAAVVHPASLEQETLEGWNYALEVNVNGPFFGIRAVLPEMRAAGGGSIINIGSVEAMSPPSTKIAYVASTAALHPFTASAALALASDGIRVNTVHPGAVRTEDAVVGPQHVLDRASLGRAADPSEISECVLFLASDRSSYVTGTELTVDGGFMAG